MISIIGIDPGGTTGVALLQMRPGPDGTPRYCLPKVFQVKCVGAGSEDLIEALHDKLHHVLCVESTAVRVRFAVESFVVGPRAGRSATPQAGAMARKIIGQLHLLAMDVDATIVERTASQVKLWATDERLKAAGGAVQHLDCPDDTVIDQVMPSLYDATVKLPHARDAARHALFAAVQDVRWPDPLSRAYSAE